MIPRNSTKKKLPLDDDLKILHFIKGMSYGEIAILYDVCTQCVDGKFRRMGYRKGHSKIRLSDDELTGLLSVRSVRDIAKDLGVSPSALHLHVKRLREGLGRDSTNIQYDEEIRAWRLDRKWSSSRIANKLHVPLTFVHARLKAMDIPTNFHQQQVVKDLESLRGAIANRSLTYQQVADEFGVRRDVVQWYAMKWGFRRMQTVAPIDDNTIIERYCTDFWSPLKIHTTYGYNRKNIIKRLKELGLYREGQAARDAEYTRRERQTGSKYRMLAGYPVVRIPEGHASRESAKSRDNFAFAHVIEMEKKLGRPLAKGEIVHHINCKKDDFDIDNLLLCKSNSQHVRLHATLENVVGMLWDMGIVSFRFDKGYYLKNKPGEEDLVEVAPPIECLESDNNKDVLVKQAESSP